MIKELESANQALDAALARYLRACTNVRNYCAQQTADVTPGLTARLDAEESSLVSFDTRLKESHAAIRFARTRRINSSAPINSLPAEILARIFSIVVITVRRALERTLHLCGSPGHDRLNTHSDFHTSLKYPDILAHVCSYWRKTAIDSRSLWANIDISTYGSSMMNIRAKEHIDRAGQSLLNLGIYDIEEMGVKRINPIPGLIPSSTRIRSLRTHTYYPPSDTIHLLTLSSAISKCTAGVLTELALQQHGWFLDIPASFIEAVNGPTPGDPPVTSIEDIDILWLKLPKQQLEDILLRVTVLRCYEMYPYWTSQAYCDLTELRLMIPHWTGTGVDEADFVNMLKSSPNLRVLEFNRHITNFSSGPIAENNRLLLNKLEVLSLRWLWKDQTETVLRWLLPITNPLQVSIACDDNEEEDPKFTTNGIKAFLTKSNLARLSIVAGHYSESIIEDLLSLNIRINTLAVEGLFNSDIAQWQAATGKSRIDTLYLLKGGFDMPCLRQLLDHASTHQIIFHKSQFDPSEQEVTSALAKLGIKATVIPKDDPSPILEWELFTPSPSQGVY